MTTGTAGARSPPVRLTRARIPATAGATSAMAPMVAIHPPSTDIHEVLGGRTRTSLAMFPSFETPLRLPRERQALGVGPLLACKTVASPSPGRQLSERWAPSRGLRERRREVGALPRQIAPSEVAVGGGLLVDRAT